MRFEYQGKKETLESLGYKVVVEQETNEDYPIPEPELGRILYSKYADRVLGHEAVNFDKFDIEKYEYLNVYAYLKGGIMMSTNNSKYPFTCRWDAGQCGYVAATKQEIREHFGVKRVTQKVLEKTYDTFRNMVQAFDDYYNKPVYYVSIEKDGEIIDGVGWVQGDDMVEQLLDEWINQYGVLSDQDPVAAAEADAQADIEKACKAREETWETKANLVLQTSYGVKDTNDGCTISVTVGIKECGTRGYFELYDVNNVDNWYAEGGLWFEGNRLVDYDGVFELSSFVEDKLKEWGYEIDL